MTLRIDDARTQRGEIQAYARKRGGIGGGRNLEGEAREVVGGVGLHLLDLLEDPLHRRVLQVVLVLRHGGSAAAADDPDRIPPPTDSGVDVAAGEVVI